jgi:hypothetical protein
MGRLRDWYEHAAEFEEKKGLYVLKITEKKRLISCWSRIKPTGGSSYRNWKLKHHRRSVLRPPEFPDILLAVCFWELAQINVGGVNVSGGAVTKMVHQVHSQR